MSQTQTSSSAGKGSSHLAQAHRCCIAMHNDQRKEKENQELKLFKFCSVFKNPPIGNLPEIVGNIPLPKCAISWESQVNLSRSRACHPASREIISLESWSPVLVSIISHKQSSSGTSNKNWTTYNLISKKEKNVMHLFLMEKFLLVFLSFLPPRIIMLVMKQVQGLGRITKSSRWTGHELGGSSKSLLLSWLGSE